jgi:hypothetical protein
MSATQENATPPSNGDNARNPVVSQFFPPSMLTNLNFHGFKPNGFSQEMYDQHGCTGCDVRRIMGDQQVTCDRNYPCGQCGQQGNLCIPGYIDPAMGLSPNESAQFLLEWLRAVRGTVGDVDQ